MDMQNRFEVVDDTPVEVPTRLRLPQSRTDQMREFIRQEMSRQSAENGHETFEEADDIEPDDEDQLPMTAYELHELEPEIIEPQQNPIASGSGAPGAVPGGSEPEAKPAKPESDDGKK